MSMTILCFSSMERNVSGLPSVGQDSNFTTENVEIRIFLNVSSVRQNIVLLRSQIVPIMQNRQQQNSSSKPSDLVQGYKLNTTL